jgi:Domain of unknown function (DUF4436)
VRERRTLACEASAAGIRVAPFLIAVLVAFCHTGIAEPIDAPAAGATPVVEVDLIDFDPAIGDIHGRLHLRLPKSMISKTESPTRDKEPYSYYDDFINSRYQVNDPGSQFMYPFDRHQTYLHFFVAYDKSNGGAANAVNLQKIPIALDCSACTFDGFDVDVSDAGSTATDIQLKVKVRRTNPTLIFSVFLAIAMWAITIVVLVLALRVAHKKEEAPEIGTMGFIAGLLFAFPAIRSAQPRVPPIGVIVDYFGFFCDEIILIIALIVVMAAWLRFGNESKTPEPLTEAEADT